MLGSALGGKYAIYAKAALRAALQMGYHFLYEMGNMGALTRNHQRPHTIQNPKLNYAAFPMSAEPESICSIFAQKAGMSLGMREVMR